MERGLQLPRRFHPDLKRYDRNPDMDDAVHDLLQFNCYEAHIPYTMQFFKDHNLAGMAYIHIRKGRIRGSLPKRYYLRNKELHTNFNYTQLEDDNTQGIKKVFLQSNTPQTYLWPSLSNKDSEDNVDTHTQRKSTLDDKDFTSLCQLWPEYSPPPKNSSCDVEIDCCAHDIQNHADHRSPYACVL